MNESIEYFGVGGEQLLGILHKGAVWEQALKSPAVIFWNVGVSHRIGPQRQFVEMARQLVDLNLNVFRFDLGGLGDSVASSGGLIREEREVADIRLAMDHLQNIYGVNEFILIGYCSGAANAHPTAVIDPRVTGLVIIDGYAYRTVGFHYRHFIRRALSPSHWLSRIRRIAKRFRARKDLGAVYFADFPPQKKMEQEIIGLTKRGVKLLFIYTAGIQSYINDQKQFWEMFPGLSAVRRNITVQYHKQANHLFAYQESKVALQSVLYSWIQNNFV